MYEPLSAHYVLTLTTLSTLREKSTLKWKTISRSEYLKKKIFKDGEKNVNVYKAANKSLVLIDRSLLFRNCLFLL
jgi:hypothetical protein